MATAMNDGTPGAAVSGRFWRRCLAIARPYWSVSNERARARGLLALLVLVLFVQTGFNVFYVAQTGEITSALAARDESRFWIAVGQTLAALVASIPFYAFFYYIRDNLALGWRRWMTGYFLDAYLCDRKYYALNASGGIDNPDQRIAEDINSFTHNSLYFLMIALGALVQLLAFAGVLWSISRELVFVLVAYAAIGNFVTTGVFGRLLVRLNFLQLRREADFRFALLRVREHAEPIAFLRGEAEEVARAKDYFGEAFANYRKVIRAQLNLAFFQFGFSFLALVLPTVVIASRVLSGEIEVGRAIQAAGAFAAVLAAVSVVIDHFGDLSRFAAGVDRLHGFETALFEAPVARRGERVIETVHANELGFEHLTVCTPGGERTLIRDLDLRVPPGRGLAIVGESGGGKSSLARVMAGLWRTGAGRVLRPARERIMFLPQEPYMILGSLRHQLAYPRPAADLTDDMAHELLAQINLADLPARFGGLDAVADWSKVLSLGERQRLGFARVLLGTPRYAVLDEATSALDSANEANLYRQLALTGTTPISVTHRADLIAHHDQLLELPGNGSWRASPIRAAVQAERTG